MLRGWISKGAHRRDLDKDGRYDDDDAVTLMDAWWPRLIDAEFGRPLGRRRSTRCRADAPDRRPHHRRAPAAPDFFDGWYGYVSKDLRGLLGRKVRGRWSRKYCGGGSLRRCRSALRASLRAALGVTREQLYGRGGCKSNAQASCFDQNRSTVASAVDIPPFPFQNRPTFQQTVSVQRDLPCSRVATLGAERPPATILGRPQGRLFAPAGPIHGVGGPSPQVIGYDPTKGDEGSSVRKADVPSAAG